MFFNGSINENRYTYKYDQLITLSTAIALILSITNKTNCFLSIILPII